MRDLALAVPSLTISNVNSKSLAMANSQATPIKMAKCDIKILEEIAVSMPGFVDQCCKGIKAGPKKDPAVLCFNFFRNINTKRVQNDVRAIKKDKKAVWDKFITCGKVSEKYPEQALNAFVRYINYNGHREMSSEIMKTLIPKMNCPK